MLAASQDLGEGMGKCEKVKLMVERKGGCSWALGSSEFVTAA